MSHHGDTRFDDACHCGRDFLTAFQLNGVRAALLHQPSSVGQSLCCINLVAHERQVYDNQTLLHTPGYAFAWCGMSSMVTGMVES